jgi:phospholipid/cholesterol/gamma-HCH transport system ATP-binding protein
MPVSRSPGPQHRTPVLNFDDCVLPLADTQGETFTLRFDLNPGELMMLHSEDDHHENALTHAVCGLLRPISGTATFLGRDWRELTPDRANALRGRIGVVFRRDNWIPYQPVLDSLILPRLHHTRQPVDAVCREATQWALRFGLPGLPRDLPAAVSARDRLAANLVRAFIGAPSLIVVENQSVALPAKLREVFINAIGEARERDAAVLWFAQDLSLCLDGTIPATRRLQLGGSGLRALETAA